MTDRELLELAAKAAGYTIVGWADSYDVSPGDPLYEVGGPVVGDPAFGAIAVYQGQPWNPLLSDGDALRLACLLRIGIAQRVEEVRVANRHISAIYESVVEDRAAATRRAIVMAAAETFVKIGQSS